MPFLAEENYPIPNKDILSWIFDDVEYDVDKPVYVDAADPSRSVSARRARDIVCRLIAGFKAAGLQCGDCVCIHAFNDIAYSLAFLAIVGAGGVYAGTNPSYTAHELAHAFRTADVKYVLVEPAVLKNVATAAAMTAIPDSNIFLFNPTAQKQTQAPATHGSPGKSQAEKIHDQPAKDLPDEGPDAHINGRAGGINGRAVDNNLPATTHDATTSHSAVPIALTPQAARRHDSIQHPDTTCAPAAPPGQPAVSARASAKRPLEQEEGDGRSSDASDDAAENEPDSGMALDEEPRRELAHGDHSHHATNGYHASGTPPTPPAEEHEYFPKVFKKRNVNGLARRLDYGVDKPNEGVEVQLNPTASYVDGHATNGRHDSHDKADLGVRQMDGYTLINGYLTPNGRLTPTTPNADPFTAQPSPNIDCLSGPRLTESEAAAVAAEPQMRDWDWLMSQGSSDWERFDDHDTATSWPAARLFSSGTTGLPKALDVSHHNFVAHHTLYMEHPVHAPRRDAAYELRRLVVNPMFHVSQVWRANLTPLRMGHYTVIMRRFETEAWLKCIDDHRISEINVVPAMVNTIVASPVSQRYSFASLRNATSGAAPMTKEQQARLKALMPPKTPLNQVWGMSETGSIGLALYYPEEDATGSCGRPIPNLDVKLVDEQGTDITAYDTRGELCVRGPTVVSGYYRNPKANASDWDDEGWFHTGDVAYCDSTTKLWYIVDRKKELIKVRGFQVAPMEIEGVLLSHPLIVDAAVIGVTLTANGSELPRAYIVLREGARLAVDEVVAYLAEKLSRFKRPDGGVVVVDKIPKNANGKFLKQKLKEMARVELGLVGKSEEDREKVVAPAVPRVVEPECVVETDGRSSAVAVVAA